MINAAGLEADTIAAHAGINPDEAGYRIHYCKGSYFALPGSMSKEVARLVYPVGWSLQDQASIHRFHLEHARHYLDLSARRIGGERDVGRSRREWYGLLGDSDPLFPI